eukprot:gene13437-14820_t
MATIRNQLRERNEVGLHAFFDQLKQLFSQIVHENEHTLQIPYGSLEDTLRRLEDAARKLCLLFEHSCFDEGKVQLSAIPGMLRDLLGLTHKICERCLYLCTDEEISPVSYVTQTINHVESPGRPHVEISKEQLEFLRSLQFTWKRIAKLLGVSVSTITRKRNIYQLEEELPEWSQLSDDELDEVVQEIRTSKPNIGERRLVGALRSREFEFSVEESKGVSNYGWPSRVRSDHGKENFGVAKYILEMTGTDRGSIITGSMVRNTRVERIHKDVYAGLFTSGILENWKSELTAMDSFASEDDILTFGIDDYEINVNDDDYQVSVPEFNFDLDTNEIAFVQETLNQANEDGIAAYLHCLNMLQDILNE